MQLQQTGLDNFERLRRNWPWCYCLGHALSYRRPRKTVELWLFRDSSTAIRCHRVGVQLLSPTSIRSTSPSAHGRAGP